MRVNQVARAARNRMCFPLVVGVCAWAGWNQFARAQDAAHGQELHVADLSSAPAAVPGITAAGNAELPNAPAPQFVTEPIGPAESSSREGLDFSGGAPEAWNFAVTPNSSERVPLSQCPTDTTRARECRVHWRSLIIESSVFNAFQNAGNLYTGYWYRWETVNGKWFQRWFDSDLGWNWNHWVDGNPAMDQYVGHPFMGSFTDYLWIQNDPKGATVQIGEPGYWKSRMRALLFTTIYHGEWKFGPFGEAGVGHIGDHPTHVVAGQLRNDTGIVELVTTPVGGLVWTVAEDELDKHLVKHLEEKPRGPAALLLISFLTPTRSTANIFRWRPPWYRDDRVVKAHTFWSEPPGPEEGATAGGETGNEAAGSTGSGAVQAARKTEVLPVWPNYGGVHEFGAWWGLSLMTGHVWGYAKDVKYMPIDVTYSYLWLRKESWNFRYAPELTALAMLDEPMPPNKNKFTQRKRTYGSGISPVGFRASFFPQSRVQPFLSTDGGMVYFIDRVLSPQGSQFMYTIDFGGGLQMFHTQRQAFTLGYRYQHLSNANISRHNPGTDTNVFYFAVSRFRTKGYR
jgi:Lipid A 3-O-deacylase (PagL)